ncbi:hypothetical protein [Aquimarina algiphila]|nr:hypothetical protein [Aquimarina algiphila]
MREKYKTLCCEAEYIKKARSHYVCEQCKDDVTIDLMMMHTYDPKEN